MLIVETYLKEVSGKGIGLFASKLIPKNAVYWVRNTDFDKIISKTELRSYPALTSNFITNYGFQEQSGIWYLCMDNARFVNHSLNPNTFNRFNDTGELIECTTTKDILPNEEIVCNYRKTCITCDVDVDFVVADS
ncbi:SET domain-containing protein-lysine N-methyltransferase [Mucilaginibacter ginkgonis]|uniref:SET domain-containing protein n=1 Tax=Mucilaginibacter ginkgonis TaxID=2682091 RepID=A0A6I4IMI5_9SPHI|nr:SET domain-containing protein [Mucilaginibacter ginkgonis]QQL50260.1 SET domain-containing protein [Mucilaginibacter ginkgonis]